MIKSLRPDSVSVRSYCIIQAVHRGCIRNIHSENALNIYRFNRDIEETMKRVHMIDHNTILTFNHYKKGKPFTGSLKGMRYRIIKSPAENEDDTDKFRVDTWPEPLCYEATDPEKITVQFFAFSQEGYEDVIAYLNEKQSDYAAE